MLFYLIILYTCISMIKSNYDIIYSNKGLLPWQGGCTFIEEGKIKIQLRKAYEHKNKIYGIYPKEEIITHELVHAKRMHLEEPCFEEILAYYTSKSSFRRYVGPLFRSSSESILFLLSFFPLIVNPLYTFAALLIPLYFIARLIKYQRIFLRALKKEPFEKLMQMTDQEIKDLR